jgi:hypothetical protein
VPGAVRDHFRHNVVGYIALFCFVLGGTAIALPGKNKVDTGDIKKNGVRASDIAPKAVTAAKIAPRSIDGLKVIDDSLGGADINESTLNIRPAPSSIGPTELADRQRRLAFTAGSLVPSASGPELGNQFSFSVLSFPDANGFATLSVDVPGGRVEGTKLTVGLLWSAGGNGDVAWDLNYQAAGIGANVGTGPSSSKAVTSATTDILTSTTFEIPAAAIQNGDLLGLVIERNGTNPADTLVNDARLHLVEIDYTANG